LFSVDPAERDRDTGKQQEASPVGICSKKYRIAIDIFILPSSQRQNKSIFSLRTLRLCGEYKISNANPKPLLSVRLLSSFYNQR
jgi:hypothetical protein